MFDPDDFILFDCISGCWLVVAVSGLLDEIQEYKSTKIKIIDKTIKNMAVFFFSFGSSVEATAAQKLKTIVRTNPIGIDKFAISKFPQPIKMPNNNGDAAISQIIHPLFSFVDFLTT